MHRLYGLVSVKIDSDRTAVTIVTARANAELKLQVNDP